MKQIFVRLPWPWPAARRTAVAIVAAALWSGSGVAAKCDPGFTRHVMDEQPFEPTENARTRYKYLLFSTNRKVDQAAESAARSKRGGVLRYEEVFKSVPDAAISYGWVKVSYPTNRRPGEQDYEPDPSRQNPLHHFSIIDHQILRTPDEFHNAINKVRGNSNDRSLLYVPGIDNSFSDGAESLTQLAVDLNLRGTPVLFSWPSEHLRMFSTTRILGLSEKSYLETTRIASDSTSYLMQTVDELSSSDMLFDLLAHSMGSDIVVNAMSLRPASSALGIVSSRLVPSATMPVLILAAPDVSTKEFAFEFRPKLIERTKHITIYCSDDTALSLSARVRHSDERLGYCVAPKQAMEGIEFVTVTGVAQDFANHSYYIISPDMLNDLKRALSSDATAESTGSIPTGTREIRLK